MFSKRQYGYPGEKAKQQAAHRKYRIKELRGQLERALSLERTFHLMALEVEAELAELTSDEHRSARTATHTSEDGITDSCVSGRRRRREAKAP